MPISAKEPDMLFKTPDKDDSHQISRLKVDQDGDKTEDEFQPREKGEEPADKADKQA